MSDELYNSLKEMYNGFIQEKESITEDINKNDYHLYNEKLRLLDSRINTLGFIIDEDNFISGPLQVLDVQEKERHRIARDLHDSSLQNLTHLVHKIELSSMYIDEDPIKAKLELATVNKTLKSVIQEIRNTIFDLRPMSIDDLGLKESLERLVDKMRQNSKLEIDSNIEDINYNNSLVLINIFRIVEECLNNAIKHSNGTKVFFQIRRKNNDCVIIVSDNGKSFNTENVLSKENGHFGLGILKERVEILSGTIDIDSKPRQGTNIRIVIPLLDY